VDQGGLKVIPWLRIGPKVNIVAHQSGYEMTEVGSRCLKYVRGGLGMLEVAEVCPRRWLEEA
jgi:hypothetical protein